MMKNFIGLLTSTDENFRNFKNTSDYLRIFDQDMYKSCDKSLKISSIAYDIINAKYDTYSTPKHLLLGNELFHHVRSSHLLDIMNRFGHTCSYKTIVSVRNHLVLLTIKKLYLSTLDSFTKESS
jgi:hypothetical protein